MLVLSSLKRTSLIRIISVAYMCKAKQRQLGCRVRSTPIDNTYYLKSSFKCTLYLAILKSLVNIALCLHMLFPSIITEICIAQNVAGPIYKPNNLFSCPECCLKFVYFVIKFFQLFFYSPAVAVRNCTK